MATEKAVDQLVGALHKAANASPGPLATQVRGIANSLVKSLKTERQGGDLTRQAPFTVVVTNFPKDLPQQDMMNIMGLFGEVTACLMLGRKAEVTFRKKAAAERVVNGFKRVHGEYLMITWKAAEPKQKAVDTTVSPPNDDGPYPPWRNQQRGLFPNPGEQIVTNPRVQPNAREEWEGQQAQWGHQMSQWGQQMAAWAEEMGQWGKEQALAFANGPAPGFTGGFQMAPKPPQAPQWPGGGIHQPPAPLPASKSASTAKLPPAPVPPRGPRQLGPPANKPPADQPERTFTRQPLPHELAPFNGQKRPSSTAGGDAKRQKMTGPVSEPDRTALLDQIREVATGRPSMQARSSPLHQAPKSSITGRKSPLVQSHEAYPSRASVPDSEDGRAVDSAEELEEGEIDERGLAPAVIKQERVEEEQMKQENVEQDRIKPEAVD